VISVLPNKRQVTVDGAAMPNYMAAMAMAYTVASPELLKGLRARDQIDFTIDAATNTIVAIKVLRTAH
jgi:Cu/Ag efflux protein CusF